jgi:hypothetical protein
LFALNGLLLRGEFGLELGGLSRVGSTTFCFELTVVVSLLRLVLCLIAAVPSLTVAAQACWGGGTGWRGRVAMIPYCGCYDYGYWYEAAPVIRLTGGYGCVATHGYDHGCPRASGYYVRRHRYATVRGVRRVRADNSVTTGSSLGLAASRVPSSPSKTVQAAPAYSASPKAAWTPMTVPVSPSAGNAASQAPAEEAGHAAGDWAKQFELKLSKISPDMSAASALLQQEGFRVDSGNKSATGWFLTAHDSNQRRGSIKLESDGTKIVLTVTG